MAALNFEYTPQNWGLFIDASKLSLKAVLLHNTKPSIPVGHAIHIKESYQNMKFLMDTIGYNTHL